MRLSPNYLNFVCNLINYCGQQCSLFNYLIHPVDFLPGQILRCDVGAYFSGFAVAAMWVNS